ncbi:MULTISPECIES: hypothetical protein [unclassified Streptomyces]|uniref:hypothetical protein n=1 Tax=unclassified Streptomyces TaxID=2593676 RepID=UPI002366190C|nr:MULTISPECIES: hypothetical protein [unclassified Streptomyces]MDF3145819.1 hypothetical protein [Streptomyces sp. T21Q-yed]WDF41773.1 hypothetical protein PBV52_35760 [Streptomyces sp. T12]
MDRSEDQILADELAALGAVSGGSGRLVRWVAMLMRKNVHEIELVIPLPFNDAVEHVSGMLNQVGRAVENMQVAPDRDEQTIRVVARGGAGGMNPVVVTALVSKGGQNGSEVRLRAAAKEGLIKQRAGEKTATLVAALLHKAR